MRVKPFFRWYDLWIGVYIDTENHWHTIWQRNS